MWLILIDAISIACPVASTFALLALAVPFTLCADVVAEHSAEDKVLFRCEFVQWTGDYEPDSLQTLAPSEVNVQVLLSCRL